MSFSISSRPFTQVVFSTVPNKVISKINTLSSRQKVILVAISAFFMIAAGYIAYRCVKNRKIEPQKNHEIQVNNVQGNIPAPAKETLNKLFKDTPYSLDNLPIYPEVVDAGDIMIRDEAGKVMANPFNRFPKVVNMPTPVMKGLYADGRAFIAIKVNYEVQDQDVVDFTEPLQNIYKANRKQEEIILLNSYAVNEPFWVQKHKGNHFEPDFFREPFINQNGVGPTEEEKDNFLLLQNLLKNNQGVDRNGRNFSLPVEAI